MTDVVREFSGWMETACFWAWIWLALFIPTTIVIVEFDLTKLVLAAPFAVAAVVMKWRVEEERATA